jgi:hypothetical protein
MADALGRMIGASKQVSNPSTVQAGGKRSAVDLKSDIARDHLHEDFTMGVIMSANLAAPFAEK